MTTFFGSFVCYGGIRMSQATVDSPKRSSHRSRHRNIRITRSASAIAHIYWSEWTDSADKRWTFWIKIGDIVVFPGAGYYRTALAAYRRAKLMIEEEN